MTDQTPPPLPKLPPALRVLHWVLIVNFVLQIFYGAYQVFFVLAPEGSTGLPLFGAATTMDHELMLIRRMYASEVWIAIGGFSVYLAITEYLPRLIRARA